MNIANMLKEAQGMQARMQKAQQELKEDIFDTTVGGGLLKVQADATGEILAIELSEEALRANDKKLIEDLVLSGVRAAMDTAKERAKNKLNEAAGPLASMAGNLPGLF